MQYVEKILQYMILYNLSLNIAITVINVFAISILDIQYYYTLKSIDVSIQNNESIDHSTIFGTTIVLLSFKMIKYKKNTDVLQYINLIY